MKYKFDKHKHLETKLAQQDLEAESGRPMWNGTMKTDPQWLELPRTWKKGRLIVVNSMPDLFHEAAFDVSGSTKQEEK